MISKNDLQRIDILLTGAMVLLVVIGIISIYSAGIDPIENTNTGQYKKQLIFFIIGVIFMVGVTFVSYQQMGEFSLVLYGVTLLVILLMLLIGSTVHSRAWIHLGVIAIQPSEFMKLFTVILLAKVMDLREREMHYFRELLLPAVITLIPVLLILKQPDTGTALVFIPVLFAMLFVGGADVTHLISIVVITAISILMPTIITYREWMGAGTDNALITFYKTGKSPFVVSLIIMNIGLLFYILHLFFVNKIFRRIYIPAFVFSIGLLVSVIIQRFLKDYQKKRLLVFLNPDLDPHGSGYNVIQSKIAVGSGGFIGKGFMHGSQTQLGFLPEKSTDFIFSVAAEEWGFIGGVVILALYAVIIFKGIQIAFEARDKFSALLATGITAIFLCHILVNIGMVIGIMPVTGIPLCFMSYGGSNLLMSMIAVGILININMRKFSN